MQHPQPGPTSIDFALVRMARRRLIRDCVYVVSTGVIVTVMVVTFYRILSS